MFFLIAMAIESTGLSLHWWDKRKKLEELDVSEPDLYGFLLNINSPMQLGHCKVPWMKRPHWVAVRWLPAPYEAFYNLDSKLKSPKRIGSSADEIRSFLSYKLAELVQPKD